MDNACAVGPRGAVARVRRQRDRDAEARVERAALEEVEPLRHAAGIVNRRGEVEVRHELVAHHVLGAVPIFGGIFVV